MEQVQQELIRSNEMLATQVWVLGGLISFLLVVLIALARTAWMDMREMLQGHEKRIVDLEAFKNKREEMILDHEQQIEDHRSIIGKLEVNVGRLTK